MLKCVDLFSLDKSICQTPKCKCKVSTKARSMVVTKNGFLREINDDPLGCQHGMHRYTHSHIKQYRTQSHSGFVCFHTFTGTSYSRFLYKYLYIYRWGGIAHTHTSRVCTTISYMISSAPHAGISQYAFALGTLVACDVRNICTVPFTLIYELFHISHPRHICTLILIHTKRGHFTYGCQSPWLCIINSHLQSSFFTPMQIHT